MSNRRCSMSVAASFAVGVLFVVPMTISAQTPVYQYQAVPGKIIGVWPDVWTVERLTQLRTRFGFNYVGVPALRAEYNTALQAGFAPSNILLGFWHGSHVTAVDSFDAGIYYVDEAVEHNCLGEPSAGTIHTPAELAAIRDYVHQLRPGAKFGSSGYKRCSHVRILATYVDLIMYSSYANWSELNVTICYPNFGWGDTWEKPWLDGPADQSASWSSMRNLFGTKFTMTWIRGREDEYATLLPLANTLNLDGLWVYHGEPIDTVRLLNFCEAAWLNGWMYRIDEALPVQLASFTAMRRSDGSVKLDWSTTSEVNNFGFFVERRLPAAEQFQLLPNRFIPGHGTTVEPHYYTLTDTSAPHESLLYRLRQLDLDGTMHLSEAVHAAAVAAVDEQKTASFVLFQNYPNPFNPSTIIKFRIPRRSITTLKVFDVLGRDVATLVNDHLAAGEHERVVNAESLANGVYVYRLTSGDMSMSRKLIVIR